ncbi:FecCD family ABC transporter permease [Veillonella caviae]|uniref:FecCD family ABC transporter permease n=1 Tax=Veillonella caviae TaxID=248316 RepID=UPI0023A8CE6C|nr:iron ABC transporter permease [Veillonella caviae]MCI5709346.1 iron ABC transporter permease [Veillonella caviae]MDY5481180.1 iron ABC transporter permease [Veillonella caviae]MDY5715358.1 iron ABC transporter permease [Veillonella caviae]
MLQQLKYIVGGALMIFLLGIALLWALSVGSVHFSLAQIYDIILNQWNNPLAYDDPLNGPEQTIIWLLRLPRLLMAAIVGAGLAVAGVVMQGIVKNPLADPYILGISSGASLGATIAILFGIGTMFGENFVGIMAFLGAMAISFGVLFISNLGGRANSTKLILAGLALSAVCSSFSSFVVYMADNKEGIQTITYWLMGSFSGTKWDMIPWVAGIVGLSILFFWSQSHILNIMLLGDEISLSLGYDLHRYRQVYLIISSLIVGFVVYSAGVIGFVGLLIPHIVRMVIGINHWVLIPFTTLSGAIFLVIADGLCRSIIPHVELPIGILISIVGAPTFVYMLVRKNYSFGRN